MSRNKLNIIMERLYLNNMIPISINPFSHMRDNFRIINIWEMVNNSMENQMLYNLKENGIVKVDWRQQVNFTMVLVH